MSAWQSTSGDARFFYALERARGVAEAALAAGYSPAGVYRRRAKDAAFAQRWEIAVAMAIDDLEAEADRRGRDGVLVPIVLRRPKRRRLKRRAARSDEGLLGRLKALAPDRYCDRPRSPQPRHRAMDELIRLVDWGRIQVDDLSPEIAGASREAQAGRALA